jgi:hypothetical protein
VYECLGEIAALRFGAVRLLSIYLVFCITAIGACSTNDPSPVRIQDLPPATILSMPVGETRDDLTQLDIASFTTFNYPKISFGGWYVATAHNRKRWLNRGFAELSPADSDSTCGTDPDESSLYKCDEQYHPGDDWSKLGDQEWPKGDLGAPIYPFPTARFA